MSNGVVPSLTFVLIHLVSLLLISLLTLFMRHWDARRSSKVIIILYSEALPKGIISIRPAEADLLFNRVSKSAGAGHSYQTNQYASGRTSHGPDNRNRDSSLTKWISFTYHDPVSNKDRFNPFALLVILNHTTLHSCF